MQGETKEHWLELCEQAAVEQDSKKLLKVIEELNRELDSLANNKPAKQPRRC